MGGDRQGRGGGAIIESAHVRIRTNNGLPICRQKGVKRVCHIYCHTSGHIKKRNAQVSISSGTQNVKKNVRHACGQFPPEKMEKTTNQHTRILHISKSGTHYFNGCRLIPSSAAI